MSRITFLFVLFCASIVARDSHDLRIQPVGMKADTSDTVELRILNISGHDLRIPPTSGFCRAMPGAVHAELLERPDPQNSVRYDVGCTACGGRPVPILEQAKRWWRLKPGQFIDVPIHLSTMLPLHEEGLYRFRLIFDAPSFTPAERSKLTAAGIVVASTGAESDVAGIQFRQGRISLESQ